MNKLILIASLFSGSIALAQKPDFSQLFFAELSKPWHCNATATPPPDLGKPHPVVATVTISDALGGQFRALHYSEKKTAENPMPLSIEELYTGTGNQFTRYSFDSFGAVLRGSGTVADGKIVFDSEMTMGPQKVPTHVAFEKHLNDLRVYLELQSPDGKWMKIWDGTCKK